MDIEELVPDEIGGLCGILSPIIAYIIIFISILIHPDFSWASKALSYLGAVDTEYNNIFNFGLIISGILGIVFTLAIIQFAESNVGYVGIGGYGAGMMSLILISVFPSGTLLHYPVSILFFSLTLAGLAIFGVDQFLDIEYTMSALIWSSIGISVVLFGIILSTDLDLGLAIPEFIGTIPFIQFNIVYGTKLYAE